MTTIKQILLYVILSIVAFISSSLSYFMGKEWIIIRWPTYTATQTTNNIEVEATKKKVKLSYWHHDRWNSELIDVVWSNNLSEVIQYIIRSLMTLLDEEQILEKKPTLQSAALSLSGNDLYLSFDRTPFNEEAPAFSKLMMLESILKTLRENGIQVPNIYFLVHHQPMQDMHLNFSHAWPLEGFIDSNGN